MAEAKLEGKEAQQIATQYGKEIYQYGGNELIQSGDPVFIKEARGQHKVYRDLERDPKVHACLQRRYDMVVNAETHIRKAPRRSFSRREDERMRDMVEYQIKSMGVSIENDDVNARASHATDFVGAQYGLLDAVLMGYSVGEIMWNTDGKEIYVQEIKIRDQSRFKADKEHRWRLLKRDDFLQGELLPRRKFLFYTNGSHYDPYGLGLGYRLYWPVWFKRKSLSFWLRFLDKYGGPTAVGKYPAGSLKDKQDLLMDAAAAIHSDHAVVIPENMAIELLQSITTAAQQGYDQIEKYLDGQISQAVLGVTLTTDISGTQGSRAAAETHMHGERGVGERDGNFLMHFFTNTLSRYITDFNSGLDTPAPQFLKIFPHYDALRELVSIDQMLFNLGYRRKLESVNEVYGNGEEVYVKDETTLNQPTNEPREDQGEEDEQEEREEGQKLTSSNGQA